MEKQPTIITVQSYDTKMTFEVPYSDVSIDKYIQGFVACLVGITFPEEVIYNGMKDFLKENCDEVC